jgi:hypothetical protein
MKRLLSITPILALTLAIAPAFLHAQKSGDGPEEEENQSFSLHRLDISSSLASTSAPLSSCGDSLSVALQHGTPEFPCWANIRTVDRWNAAAIGYGISPMGYRKTVSPQQVPSSFHFTTGGLSAFSLPGDGQGKAYGGLAAVSGLLERRRWQVMFEDAGGGADFQFGGAHFVGLNLSAVRATGEVTPRLTWQGSATNTYGTDASRQVVPLDYRMIGQEDAPAPDVPAYGLHGGLMTEGEEEIKLRYENSRNSAWDFSASDNYTKYNADRFLVHTERGRLEYLHTIANKTSLGVYGNGARQDSSLACSLGGGGLRLLTTSGVHSSINLSGGIAGAGSSCGKRIQFVGQAAYYAQLSRQTDFYVTARRDLGDGVLEQTVFLNSGGLGLRHLFHHGIDTHVSLNELYGSDPITRQTYHGSFVDGSLHYRLPGGFSNELELRRFSFSGLPEEAGRTVGVFTLWWTPPHDPEGPKQRASLR